MSTFNTTFESIQPSGRPCIEHIRLQDYATDAIAHVIHKQWRQSTGRTTYVVAGADEEAVMLHEDLQRDGIPAKFLECVRPEAQPERLEEFPERIFVLTYQQMMHILLGHSSKSGWLLRDTPSFPNNITIILNFGMVDISYNMAICFALLATSVALRKYLLVVVSINEAPLPGPGSAPLARIHEVVVQ